MWSCHDPDLLVQHIAQMLNRIWIWGMWQPGQDLELFVMFFKPLRNSSCSVYFPIDKMPLLSRNTIAMIGVYGLRQCCDRCHTPNYPPHEWADQVILQQNIAQSITLLSVHPGAISSQKKQRTCTHLSMWCKRKWDSLDLDQSQSQWSHLHCRHFHQWTGVSMGILISLWLHNPLCRKLRCTVCCCFMCSFKLSSSHTPGALLLLCTRQDTPHWPHTF